MENNNDNKDVVQDEGSKVKEQVADTKPVKKKKGFKMPNAYVIVFMVLVLIAILTWFIPTSVHRESDSGVIYNATLEDITDPTSKLIEGSGPQPKGIWDILMAPIHGFVNSAGVGVALLMAGGFLSVMSVSGGLEAAIGKMLKKLKGAPLIAVMTLIVALMGTVFGFWEETLAFALVIIPMFVMAGYDVMVGMGVLFLGATVGNMASVVNPFATGVAVSILNAEHETALSAGSGIILRMVLFVITYVMATLFLCQYGAKVKKDPTKSAVYGIPGIKTSADGDEKKELPEMTTKRALSAAVFVVLILLLIIGYIPWKDLGGDALFNIVNAPIHLLAKIPFVGSLFGHITEFGTWYFPELAILFFIGALLLMFINKISADDFMDAFIAGASDLLGVVIVLALANGISDLMGSEYQGISVTLVNWISGALEGIPSWTFGIFAVGAYLLIGLALQSTSGVAGISMPILGPVTIAMFATAAIGGVGGQILLISAYTIGLSFMCLVYPGAETLGVASMFGIPYPTYLKVMLRWGVPILVVATAILSIAPYIGLAK